MKKFLLAALMAGVATSAFAADLPTRKAPPAPAPVYAPPMFTWTGFYVGVNGGYGFANTNSNSFGNPNGGFAGGTLGYNYQMGQLVLGAEGDWDWASMTHTQAFVGASNKLHIDQILTARARVGVAMDRTLLYVTGGYAGMQANGWSSVVGWDDKWRSGGALGLGLEYAFTNNITAKAEYLYLPMAKATYFTGTAAQVSSPLNASLFRVGLNYKF